MNSESIREMLETQYRPFIREDPYIDAFDQAMKVFDELKTVPKSASDPLYYFMHQLILHLVGRISNLEKELVELKKQ